MCDVCVAEKKERGAAISQDEGAGVGYLAQFRLFDAIPSLHQDFEVPAFCRLGRYVLPTFILPVLNLGRLCLIVSSTDRIDRMLCHTEATTTALTLGSGLR